MRVSPQKSGPSIEGRFRSAPAELGPERLVLPEPKALAVESKPSPGRRQIGFSRREDVDRLPEPSYDWRPVAGGVAVVVSLTSPGAKALRVGLALNDPPPEFRLAVGSRAEWLAGTATVLDGAWVRSTYGAGSVVVWTPTTVGDEQVVEAWLPSEAQVRGVGFRILDVSHIFESLEPAAGSGAKLLTCHVNYSCSTNSTILTAGKAVARMVITEGGNTGLCSGSLLGDRGNTGTPWFATANHCLSTAAAASSTDFYWSYEVPCGGSALVATASHAVGSQLVFTNASVDFTLLRVTSPLPPGVVFLGWDATELALGTPIFGIHHPGGAPKAYSIGTQQALLDSFTFRGEGTQTWTIATNTVGWQSGAVEPGSSGSPLMSGSGVYRGALSAVLGGQACGAPLFGFYSRFSQVYPRIRQYIDPATTDPDEANSAAATFSSQPEDYTTKSLLARLNSPGDEDWFRFSFPRAGVWVVYSETPSGSSATDTVGRIYNSDGVTFSGLQDDDSLAPHFGIAARVNGAGRFFVRVTGKNNATGPYVLNSIFVADDDHSNFFQLADALAPNATASGRIDYGGDSDKFAIDLPSAGRLVIASSGSTDVVGNLYDASLRLIAGNDDVSTTNANFQIDTQLPAGRYYLDVIGYDVDVVGAYSVRTTFSPTASGVNYTNFWWNPNESGWGLNLNHQGNSLFAAMYTYATDGQPMWLVSSGLDVQGDGSFAGPLFRFTGPPYFQTPFVGASGTQVGTMTVRFTNATTGTLTYSFNGTVVTKAIQVFTFGTPPTCTAGSVSRATATNYQDLWWNANEGGWGLGLAHQGNTIFAAMYNYNNARRDVWLVGTGLVRQADGAYTGDLFFVNGPPFNAQPWGAITASSVGTMTLRFSNGETGTVSYTVLGTAVTKNITRYLFGATAPTCR